MSYGFFKIDTNHSVLEDLDKGIVEQVINKLQYLEPDSDQRFIVLNQALCQKEIDWTMIFALVNNSVASNHPPGHAATICYCITHEYFSIAISMINSIHINSMSWQGLCILKLCALTGANEIANQIIAKSPIDNELRSEMQRLAQSEGFHEDLSTK